MKNLNTSSGSKFYVELKNSKNTDVKCFFHADIHYSNDDKKIKQVKLTNNIMHTRTLETDFLVQLLNFNRNTLTLSNKQPHGLELQRR